MVFFFYFCFSLLSIKLDKSFISFKCVDFILSFGIMRPPHHVPRVRDHLEMDMSDGIPENFTVNEAVDNGGGRQFLYHSIKNVRLAR